MAVDRTLIFNLVKAKAGLGTAPDAGMDPIVDAAVDEAEELILNYTCRTEIPSLCRSVWAAIAADIYKYNIRDFDLEDKLAPTAGGGEKLLRNVSEIRIDDAIVSDDITAAKYQADAQSQQAKGEVDFLKNYRERLHRFRLVQWRKWDS